MMAEKMKTKLEVRKAIKARKPTYKRVQANQFAKLANDEKWRRPKGMGNKDRRNRKGHVGMLKIGYGSPKEVRGTNRAGMFEVVINSVADVESIDTKTQVGVIGRSVGLKKRAEILKAASSKKVEIVNAKQSQAKIDERAKELGSKSSKASKSAPKKTEAKADAKAEEKPKKEAKAKEAQK